MGNLASICARNEEGRYAKPVSPTRNTLPREESHLTDKSSTPGLSATPPTELKANLAKAEDWEPSQAHPTHKDARIAQRRRFHAVKDSPYVQPADICEQDRLNLQHNLLLYGFGKLYHFPLEKQFNVGGMKVLDCGCGSGGWARNFALNHPGSEVIGLDMAKTLFTDIEVLPNATFQVGNVLERLPFPDDTFDATYQRLLFSGIPKSRWVDVIKELMRVTKPGGYIELVETNVRVEDQGPSYKTLLDPLYQSLQVRGIDVDAGLNINEYMLMAGMDVLEENIHSAPFNWGGDFGKYQQINGLAFWSGMRPFLCDVLDISKEEFDELLEKAQNECHSYKTYANYHSVLGRVPITKKYQF